MHWITVHGRISPSSSEKKVWAFGCCICQIGIAIRCGWRICWSNAVHPRAWFRSWAYLYRHSKTYRNSVDFMHLWVKAARVSGNLRISDPSYRNFLWAEGIVELEEPPLLQSQCASLHHVQVLTNHNEISYCDAARSLCHHTKNTNKYTCMHGLATNKESTSTNRGSRAKLQLLSY